MVRKTIFFFSKKYYKKMNMFSRKISMACCRLLKRQKSTVPQQLFKKIKCGQPTAETHPHLVKPGEIVPYIQVGEFQERRQKLVDLIFTYNNKLNENLKSHLIVIPSATKKYMSDKIPYIFRQNTDYLYLSGCMEPDTCLVINTIGKSTNFQSTLFVRSPDSHAELWDGPRTNADSATQLFGVDRALSMSDLTTFLHSFLSTNRESVVWFDLTESIQPGVDKIVSDILRNISNIKIESVKKFIHRLRLIKSPAEIALMKRSCEIASEAINETIAHSKPDILEHEIFAKVDYECRVRGAEYLAYPPVVAGGERATTIHYINNNQVVPDGDMVLMDAGCEYHGYSSDITRTWPVNGTFSPQQKLLYEIIKSVQSDLIKVKLLQLEGLTLDSLFNSMCTLLGKKLKEIGLISNKEPPEAEYKRTYEFCPHHVSHYLGMDVHDTPLIPRNIPLQPGMIITVEPGIYISSRHNAPKEFQGIGIRIEDDVLITENGPVILTNKCIKNVDDIENIIYKKR